MNILLILQWICIEDVLFLGQEWCTKTYSVLERGTEWRITMFCRRRGSWERHCATSTASSLILWITKGITKVHIFLAGSKTLKWQFVCIPFMFSSKKSSHVVLRFRKCVRVAIRRVANFLALSAKEHSWTEAWSPSPNKTPDPEGGYDCIDMVWYGKPVWICMNRIIVTQKNRWSTFGWHTWGFLLRVLELMRKSTPGRSLEKECWNGMEWEPTRRTSSN